MNAREEAKNLRIGTVMEWRNGDDRAVLLRRKEAGEGNMPGWWVEGGGGLADSVIDAEDSEWRVVAPVPSGEVETPARFMQGRFPKRAGEDTVELAGEVETPEAAVGAIAHLLRRARIEDLYDYTTTARHVLAKLRAQGWTPPGGTE